MNDELKLDLDASFDADEDMEADPEAEPCTRTLPAGHVKRDELVSTMLQDRNVLRLITGPAGFGKTELAHEYARRLFSADDVTWIDATSPDFLLILDKGDNASLRRVAAASALVVFDGLPWLHEERARTLSECIDEVLFAGIEVIVTTTPSCDSLSALQTDRVSIHAADLLVSEQECAPCQVTEQDGGSRAFARKRWNDAGKRLFGRVPSVIWGVNTEAQRDCLKGLFAEKLPLDLICGMFAMFLFETGGMRDLEAAGIMLRSEDIALIVRDYPVFGIDTVSGCLLYTSPSPRDTR